MELHPKQSEAITACCDITNRIVVVTGAAGTGKTTILKRAVEAQREAGYQVALCAPTGKAAKRIYEATQIDAMTIHRLLEYSHPGDPHPKTGKPMGVSIPKRDRQNPLDFDIVYVDEAAMINNDLYRSLLDALPNGASIRFFGDDNQLAPIEEDKRLENEPSPFQKLLANPKFKSVVLEQIFRQGADSGILGNANLILRGRHPTRNDQFSIKMTDQPVNELRNYILEQAAQGIHFNTTENQILLLQNKSWVGTWAINTMLQGMYHNEAEPCLKLDRKPWDVGEGGKKGEDGGKIRCFVGDKVICTANLYDLGVFNGESGIVLSIDDDTGEIEIDFGDRVQVFPPVLLVQNRYGNMASIDPRKDLSLGYAVTTHKAQGSEYQRVVYILNKSTIYMANRRNFYTAVTRAKEHVHLIADQRGLAAATQKRG